MSRDLVIGLVLLAIGGGFLFIGLPNKARFLRFESSLVLYPPVVLVFLAGGVAELTAGLLRIDH